MAKKWNKLEKRVRVLENALADLVIGMKSAVKMTRRKKTKKKKKIRTRTKTPRKTKATTKGKKASKAPARMTTTKTRRASKKALPNPMTLSEEVPAGTPELFS
jgi:hypothetical protein